MKNCTGWFNYNMFTFILFLIPICKDLIILRYSDLTTSPPALLTHASVVMYTCMVKLSDTYFKMIYPSVVRSSALLAPYLPVCTNYSILSLIPSITT